MADVQNTAAEGHEHSHFDYEHQEPRNPLIAFLLIGSCVFLVACVIFLQTLFDWTRGAQVERVVEGVSNPALTNLRQQEDEKLKGYGYVDKDKGVVRIPIERAMDLVAQEAKAAQPQAETAKPTVLPAGAKPAESHQPDGKK